MRPQNSEPATKPQSDPVLREEAIFQGIKERVLPLNDQSAVAKNPVEDENQTRPKKKSLFAQKKAMILKANQEKGNDKNVLSADMQFTGD